MFQQEPTRGPVEIRNLVVILKDAFDEQGNPYQSAHFQIEVVMDGGSRVQRRGDLAQHITPTQRSALMAFMDSLREQAEEQIL